jgi:hypothetical protein
MSTARLYENPVLFSDFCLLLDRIRAIKPKRIDGKATRTTARVVLDSWVERLRSCRGGAVPYGTVTIILRLLFPDEGVRRRSVLS